MEEQWVGVLVDKASEWTKQWQKKKDRLPYFVGDHIQN